MQEIAIHCRKCGKGLRMSYTPCGCLDDIVLKGITLRCKTCTRVITPRKFTERHIIENVVDGKFMM